MRLIWEEEIAVAEREVGVEGGVVSEAVNVVKVLFPDTAELPAASLLLTR